MSLFLIFFLSTATYYDAANRPIADVNVGTNGGSARTRPDDVPSRSDDLLVTSYSYNAAGLVQDVTDPMGIVMRTEYDALGRTTETIANYTGSSETADSDVATQYTYDGDNHVLTVTAGEPGGAYQTTEYVYGVTTSGGSALDSNDLLAAVEYPNASTGAPSSSSEDTYTYNALGQVTSMTDRDGNTHTYSYDVLGRLTSDAVTTLGSGVDGSVRRIEYGYDALGNLSLTTSYDAASGGSIVNQVLDVYDSLAQLTAEYQSVSGAVDTSTTPEVQYAYDATTGRLTSITYPDGYVLDYNYGTSGSINDTINRLASISDETDTLESYVYQGLDTVVGRDHPQDGVNLIVTLDAFGRVAVQDWYDTATSSAVDEYEYGYDADSNVLYSENLVNTTFSELYTYNDLSELTSFERGTLTGPLDGISGTPTDSQSWDLDALGNFTSVTTNGTTVDNTANQQNEYTALGSVTPTYDANGNMTTDETGQTYVYDAWNRLVEVKDSSGDVEASYSYDGLGRQITEAHGDTTTDLYFSAAGQVLEEDVKKEKGTFIFFVNGLQSQRENMNVPFSYSTVYWECLSSTVARYSFSRRKVSKTFSAARRRQAVRSRGEGISRCVAQSRNGHSLHRKGVLMLTNCSIWFLIAVYPFQTMPTEFDRGYEALKNMQADRAIQHFTSYIKDHPGDARALALRGAAYHMKKQYDAAIKDCNESLRLDNKCVEARRCRAAIFADRAEYECAIREYSDLIQLFPSDWMAFNCRAQVYTSVNEFDKAIADFTEGIRLQPVFMGYYLRAMAYRNKREFAHTIADLKKACELFPQFVPAVDTLAWHLATCPVAELRDGKKAIEYATRACEFAEWKEPGFLDTLAAACAEAGEFKDAVKWQSKAMELLGKNNEIGLKTCKERISLFEAHKRANYEKGKGVGTAFYISPSP